MKAATQKLAKQIGATIGKALIDPGRPHVGYFITVTAPDGMRFAPDDVVVLLCLGWDDAYERLASADLEEDPECDE